ncbi:MFS transporter [Paludibacterium paludis]|uniref:MFS transporter n=1 Tax=Paludibacterium paludis TaxID=1225769 RepID=A0A918NZW5_9NEIS|nr:MFS transporter [Paludibacterium paludis]GGY08546.1 MFS transporter [Paludibacterium paludis]
MTIRIKRWEPENIIFWSLHGRRIAKRNLILSTLALHLNFNVWMMWSMVVVNLPQVGFLLSGQQQFLLVSIPPLVGAFMRVIYSWIWSWVGGGTWVGVSTLLLLIPTFGVAHTVQDISTPFPMLLMIGALCGFGGGASASHLPNTSFFYPKSAKGFAMGMNAGMGNLGVSVAQLLIPLVISVELFGWRGGEPQIWGLGSDVHAVWLQNAGYIWIVPILVIAVLCLLYSHDLPKLKMTPRDQLRIMKHPHTWYVGILYLGSYGTFLGFSMAYPLLARYMFPGSNATTLAFVGPMLCALSRPIGGWCGDRVGGGMTTMLCNAAMGMACLGLYFALPGPAGGGSFVLFFLLFQVMFLAAGIGNGSSYQLAPKVHLIDAGLNAAKTGRTMADAYAEGGRRGAAAMNVSSVLAALGGFFIPKSFGTSLDLFDSFLPAFLMFLTFYMACTFIAWFHYARHSAPLRC